MSYQALARKWRPRNFDEVIGQEHVVSALTNALDSQRVHHAYLFTGTRGVGKTSLARIFARALNCENGISASPCGECIACRGVDQGNYIDLIEVDAASRTKVDDTRELLDNVQYAPTQGRFKIYLIDEVHMLSGHSFNALLKTLEEPPAHVKFLLATTDPQKLPATILSRCIQFNLKAMDIPRLNSQLEKILKAEDIEFDPQALMILSRSADGSVRDALSLLDQAIAFGNGSVHADQIKIMLGMIDDHFTRELLQHICQQNGKAVLDIVARMSERSIDYGAALDDLLSALHNIALYQVNPKAVEWKGADITAVSALSDLIDAELLQLLYQIGLVGKRDLVMAPDPRIGFEMVMLRMTAFQPASTPQSSPDTPTSRPAVRRPSSSTVSPDPAAEPTRERAVPAVENQGVTQNTNDEASQPDAVPATQPAAATLAGFSLDIVASVPGWSEFAEKSGLTGISRELVMNMVPHNLEGNRLSLILDQGSQHLFNDARLKKIQQFCCQQFGQSIQLNVSVDQVDTAAHETPSQQKQRQHRERQESAENAFGNDPNVQQLVDLFDAEIVTDTIRPGDS